MAIDTLERRASALADPWGMPFPDGETTAADRGWQLGFYTGIAATAPVPDYDGVILFVSPGLTGPRFMSPGLTGPRFSNAAITPG